MQVKQGFKDVYGFTWTSYQVDSYNRIQNRIERCKKESRKAPEELLNASHKCYHAAYTFNQLTSK